MMTEGGKNGDFWTTSFVNDPLVLAIGMVKEHQECFYLSVGPCSRRPQKAVLRKEIASTGKESATRTPRDATCGLAMLLI